MDANEILVTASAEMSDRATAYDAPGGERSMAKTVEMFNTLTKSDSTHLSLPMTETQGWLFMAILKMVRSTQGEFKNDNYVDGAAYMALAGESANPAERTQPGSMFGDRARTPAEQAAYDDAEAARCEYRQIPKTTSPY